MIKTCLITACLDEAAEIGAHIDALRKSCQIPGVSFYIVDGGSSDGTDTLLRQKLIKTEYAVKSGSGIYEAWNYAIAANPDCNYYCFLGVGDTMNEQGLVEALSIAASKEPAIIYGPAYANTGKLAVPRKIRYFSEYHWGRLPFCHAGTLFSAELFHDAGLFNPQYKICGDLEWILRVKSSSILKNQRHLLQSIDNILATMRQGGISSDERQLNIIITETKAAHRQHSTPIAAKRRLYFWLKTAQKLLH